MEHSFSKYKNRFIPTKVHDGKKDHNKEEFKTYYENRKTRENREDFHDQTRGKQPIDLLSKIPQHILTSQDHKFRKYLNNDLMSTNRVDFETTDRDFTHTIDPEEVTDQFRYIKPVSTTITVDSRLRDKSIYPRPNSYKVVLPKNFHNVKRISLRSTTFPNPSQLIRDTPTQQANNNLFWQDDNETTTVFNAVITPGNYTASLLAAEIETRMNQIPRDDGGDHNFRVSIDQVTDIVTISSYQVVSANNVIYLDITDPSTVTVNISPNEHGFSTGDLIDVSGLFTTGGVPSSELNGIVTILVIDIFSFTYQISSSFPVVSDVIAGGGTVSFSKGLDFKLFFDELDHPNTIAGILAFPLENTEFASVHTNTIIRQAFPIKQILSIDNTYTAILIDIESDIIVGTEVRLHGINEFSPPINSQLSDGVGYLLIDLTPGDVVTLNDIYKVDVDQCKVFKIAIDTSTSVTSNNISSNIDIDTYIQLTEDSYAVRMLPTYPIITGFFPFQEGGSFYTAIEFDGAHGFVSPDTICIPEVSTSTLYVISELSLADRIELESSYPLTFNVSTVYDSYLRIDIPVPQKTFYRQVIDPIVLLTKPYPPGYILPIKIGGRLSSLDGFLTFNTPLQTTSGYSVLPLSINDQIILDSILLNDPSLDITAHFKVLLGDGVNISSLGQNGYLSYGQYVFTRTNNRRVILTGDPYIFMTSPSLETILSIGDVKNIFAKLQLASSAGDVIYNSFISSPYTLEDAPLQNIYEFDVSFRYFDNSLVNFNDIDHSFCIEIVEYHDKLRYNHFDSRRGRYDDVRIRQDYK
jgi:hypothetical protein